MSRLYLTAVLGILWMLLVSGCLTEYVERTTNPPRANPQVQDEGPPEEAEIDLLNVSTDKDIYHSAEVMNLTVLIRSSSDVENVTVTANGINGRMNIEKTLNLDAGENGMSFTYKLPRCNVCGGIRAGTYDLTCEVSYGGMTVKNSTSVQIVQ